MPVFAVPSVGPEEQAAVAKIDELRQKLRFYVAEPRRWVGSVRRVLAARAIQGSNSIEGFNVSIEDAIAAVEGEQPDEADRREVQAVLGYRRAMTYVIQLAGDDHFQYSPVLIRSLHFMMTEYEMEAGPGLWRRKPIWVRSDRTGEAVYEAPHENDVAALVDELVSQLASHTDVPAMIRAAMAHLNLVMIHPFRDGNGRMSRCLQTLVLAREQILAQELCSIDEYLGRNTQSYYDILAQVGRGRWHPEGDARPWVRYCLRAHYIQAASVLRRVKESEAIWLELDRLRLSHRLHERTVGALFDAAIGLRIRNAGYRTLVRGWGDEISNQVATLDLKAMVAAGLLTKVGEKRGTFYVAGEPIKQVAAAVSGVRRPIESSNLFALDEPELPFSDQ